MKAKPLLFASGLLAFVAGCATTPVKFGRVPIKADAHFTLAHFELSQVDDPPEVASVAPLDLTLGLGADVVPGYATIQFIIDKDGIPREVQCVEASDAAFARAAASSVADSRFRPGRKGGEAVATRGRERFKVGYGASGPTNIHVGNDPLSAAMTNRYDDYGVFVSNYQHQ